MFDTSYLRTVNELKFVAAFKKFSTPVLTAILSMAGIPPLMGFCTKFILFILIFEKLNFFFILLFSVFNMFSMFFYIQNFRHLSSNKNYQSFYLWGGSFENYTFFTLLNSIQFLNFFFIFIFEDFLFYFYNITFFMVL
jgi:NADH:ubiquinone oxidoreductase subunit 2 (subunit N)